MEVTDLAYISIASCNRDLLVINDMDTFARFFCYAKKQKKGAIAASTAVNARDDIDAIDKTLLERSGDIEEDNI